MPIYYTNRKNQKHYLRAAKTKKGGTRYYIIKNKSKYKEAELLDAIPDGFEFYEEPMDARVSLRKVIQPLFTQKEEAIVAKVLKEQTHFEDFIVERDKEDMIVHITQLKRDSDIYINEEHFIQVQWYREQLLFKKDKENYIVHRFCSLSRYYGWIPLETHEELKYLADKYIPHVNKDSLLKFWIEGEEDY